MTDSDYFGGYYMENFLEYGDSSPYFYYLDFLENKTVTTDYYIPDYITYADCSDSVYDAFYGNDYFISYK